MEPVRPRTRAGAAARLATAALGLVDRLPVLLLALGAAGVLAALVGQVRPLVVLPVAAALAVATWRLVPPPPRADARQLGALAALVALCGAWVAVGARFVGEYVVVNRDPGFLTLRALWLAEHPSALIAVGDAATAAAAAPGASAGTEAFFLDGGLLHAQGNVMLPALLGMQGWLGGERAVLAGNLTLGAVALVAVFGAARRFTGPVWALVPTAALAASLPFLVFTRSAYTEPLTVALGCGGLALAHAAWTGPAGRARDHVLVGALVGSVAAARIDGAVAVVGLVLGLVVVALGPLGRSDRRGARRAALAATAGATVMVALGLVDVLVLSPDYAREHAEQLGALLGLTGAVVVVAAALLLAPSGWAGRARRSVHRHRRGLGAGGAAGVLVLGVVLATRPWWWQGRFVDPASGSAYAVQVLQAAAGQPLDGARSYDEETLTWVVWYLGLPAVVLGFAGLALLAHRAAARREAAAVVLAAVIGVAAVFPLVRISITPDQIWAVRRLLPATLPGLLLTATVALAALAGAGRAEPGSAALRSGSWAVARRVASGVLAASVVAFPLTTWRPGASVVELSGRATQAHAVCDALDELGVDRVVWTHSSPFRYLATLRVLCDVEVVEFVDPPTTADLAAVRAAWGGGPVAALSFDAGDYVWTSPPRASVGGVASTTLGRTLTGVPRTVDTTWSEVWVGLVQDDGTVAPAG